MRTHVTISHALRLTADLLAWQPRVRRVPGVVRRRFAPAAPLRLRSATEPDLVAFRDLLSRLGPTLSDLLIDLYGWDGRPPAGPGRLTEKYQASPFRVAQTAELAEGKLRSDPELRPVMRQLLGRRDPDTLRLAADLSRMIRRRAPAAWRDALIESYLASLNGVERFALDHLHGSPREAAIAALRERFSATLA
jgi:hypothetical protein